MLVHWYRNAFSHVPRAKMREAVMLKAIHAQESRRRRTRRLLRPRAAELKRMKLGKLAEWIAATVAETLSYHALHEGGGC